METPDASSQPPIIEMSGVSVSALKDSDKVILEDMNWSVQPGEYWVVAGMQGTGKSDLLSMTAGLTPPKEGSYRLFNLEMPIYDEALKSQRLRVGLVFDGGQLLHQLTVRENIALPLRYHRALSWQEIDERVNAILEWTELKPHAETMAGAVGRNWQKRAGLARALVLEPELLLLDNPVSGMDSRQVTWWLGILGQLSSGAELMSGKKLTLVVTAEDLRPWRNLPCHFAILKKQRFLSMGHRPRFSNHEEPLVQELLAGEVPHT